MSNESPTTATQSPAASPPRAKKRKGGPACSVCGHHQRDQLDRLLLLGDLTSADVARIVGCHRSTVSRHIQKHVLAPLTGSADAELALADIDIAEEITSLYVRARRHLREAESTRNPKALAAFHREARADLELLAKLKQQLQPEGVINVTVHTEWLSIRSVIFQALAPFPDARAAVAAALLAVEADVSG